ncbi:MAG: heavy metal-associated domain-containing protein [Nanoarchaeota archaeon]|nr:heavy metal-associated domain-containing protein [Nanoarchaeota archaeon]
MKKFKVMVEGMHCASCASNIERSVSKVSGVKNASVNVLTRKGIIEAEDSVKAEDIKNAVAKTGYKVASLSEE